MAEGAIKMSDGGPIGDSKGVNAPDVRTIMAEIRERVKADIEQNKGKIPPFAPKKIDENTGATRRAGELLHSEELRYLNLNHTYGRLNLDSITSHRPGVIGKLIVKFKKKFLSMIWDNLLKDYLAAEREYQGNLVRFLNDVSKYVDARDASNFWEIIRKIDYDINKALTRIERIADDHSGALRSVEAELKDIVFSHLRDIQGQLEKLSTYSEQHEDKLRVLDSVARGLEGIVSRIPATSSAAEASSSDKKSDYSYVLLENRYRGSEAEIEDRMKVYAGIFAKAPGKILDIGAGRGELLNLFKISGIEAYGVDPDNGMVQEALKKGLEILSGEGISHLRSLPDRSLGGIVATQVVEHLTRDQLAELFTLCKSKVKSGGLVAFETINPQSILALSSNYFRDPTHIFPLHPETLRYALDLSGLRTRDVIYLSPVPKEAQLREVPVDGYMTQRWADAISLFNRNIQQLNSLLYGYQDFCVVADVP